LERNISARLDAATHELHDAKIFNLDLHANGFKNTVYHKKN
jgi:hypothetical protein